MRRPVMPGWAEKQTPTPFLYHKLNLKLYVKLPALGCLIGLLCTYIMTDAHEQNCWKVLSDLFSFFPWRTPLVWLTLLVSIIFLIISIYINSLSLECICEMENSLFNANLSIMGVDMAALAILFALFQDKQLSNEAKKAFKEQCGVFLFNAVVQLMALVIFIMCALFSVQALLYGTYTIQIWAILLVFDVIVELFTLISAIINK